MRLAQLDRAFGYGPKGRGFESSNARRLESPEILINKGSRDFSFALKGVGPPPFIELVVRLSRDSLYIPSLFLRLQIW